MDMPDIPPKKLAMVAALEREVRPLIRHWQVTDREHDGGRFRFFETKDVVVVCGGIGAAAARRAGEAVLALFCPETVISVGFAGALESSLKVGDVLRPRKVINAADGSSVLRSDGNGVLVSFGSVASPEQKQNLGKSFGAQAVDMEAASVARAAEARRVDFLAVKVISDEVGFEFPSTERFIDVSGRFSELRFAVFAILRPWLWFRVIQLARNSTVASHALCTYLREFSVQQGRA